MSVQKTFKIRERLALLFRAESYNLFNRANYYNPVSTYSLDGVTPYSQFGRNQVGPQPSSVSVCRADELVNCCEAHVASCLRG